MADDWARDGAGQRGEEVVIYIVESVTVENQEYYRSQQDVVMNYPGLREISSDRSRTCP